MTPTGNCYAKAAVRALILSDIHANLPALDAVLAHARTQERYFDTVYNLGDAVGYGPHPRKVLDRLRMLDARNILGNHEVALLQLHAGQRPITLGTGTQVLAWQLSRLSQRDITELSSWKEVRDDVELGARLRHGTPLELDTYLDLSSAQQAFRQWNGKLAFAGHTHKPAAYATLQHPDSQQIAPHHPPPHTPVQHETQRNTAATERLRHHVFTPPRESDFTSYRVPPNARVILNVGSVGQPRDGDPRASYGIFDTAQGCLEVYRVPYDIARTQADLRAANLPEALTLRLAKGK